TLALTPESRPPSAPGDGAGLIAPAHGEPSRSRERRTAKLIFNSGGDAVPPSIPGRAGHHVEIARQEERFEPRTPSGPRQVEPPAGSEGEPNDDGSVHLTVDVGFRANSKFVSPEKHVIRSGREDPERDHPFAQELCPCRDRPIVRVLLRWRQHSLSSS